MNNLSLREHVRRSLPKPVLEVIDLKRSSRNRLPIYPRYRDAVRGRRCIEVGGPSEIFRTILPIYTDVASVDGVNFGSQTLWEGKIRSGDTYRYYHRRRGRQFVCDATDLSSIDSETYEGLLSCNSLEHIANPLKALREWRRVLSEDGTLIIVLPNKSSNFDHDRPTTTFEHILDDAENDVGEDDLTHLDEILALHDLSMDLPAGDIDAFRSRSLKNFENRALHHHVFDGELIERVLNHACFRVLDVTETRSDFFALARKSATIHAEK